MSPFKRHALHGKWEELVLELGSKTKVRYLVLSYPSFETHYLHFENVYQFCLFLSISITNTLKLSHCYIMFRFLQILFYHSTFTLSSPWIVVLEYYWSAREKGVHLPFCGWEGEVGQSLYWSPKERIDEAEPAGLGLAGLNNFSGLWAIEDVPRCLVPGPGVIRQVDSGL